MEKMLADASTGMGVMLENLAMQRAMIMLMRWLEKKRIRHCGICPGTEGLRQVRNQFWCSDHFDAAVKANALKDQQEKEAAEKGTLNAVNA